MLQRVRSTITQRYGSTADHRPHSTDERTPTTRLRRTSKRLTMLPRTKECLFLALTAALLIILGTFGIFSAEAASFKIIVSEVQTYGSVVPIDANDPALTDPEMATIPGLPY